MKFFLSLIVLCFIFQLGFSQNVGIGTATPDASAKLDVSSTDKGLLIPRVGLSSSAIFGLSGATGTSGMIVYNTNASMTGGYGVGFYYWTGAWNKVATGNPIQAVLNDGQILIGNASNVPVANTMSGDVLISNTGVTTIQDNSVDGTDITISAEANGDLLYFNGTDWVRLASGTSGQILRTNGTAAPTWSNPNDLFDFRNGLTKTAPNIVELGGTLIKTTVIANNGYNFAIDGTGNVGIGYSTPANKLSVNGTIEAIDFGVAGSKNVLIGDDAFFTDIDQANIIGLYGNGNNAVGGIRFGNNAQALIYGSSGNIGINTTDPTQILHVAGSTSGDFFTYNPSGISVYNAESTSGEVRVGSFWDRPGVYSSTDLQLFAGAASNNIIVGNNNNELLRITNTGIIRLDDQKNQYAGIEAYYGDADRYGLAQAPGGNTALYTSNSYAPSFISFNLATGASSFSELARIAHNGNMGIGFTDPQSKLHVNGDVFIPDGRSFWIGGNSDAATSRLRVHHTASGNGYIDFTGDLLFRPAGGNVTIKSNGVLEAQSGLKTERQYYYFTRLRDANGSGDRTDLGNWDFCANAGQRVAIGDDAFDGGSDNDRYVNECFVEIQDQWPMSNGYTYAANWTYNSRPNWNLYSYSWCQYDQHVDQYCMAICVNFDY